MIIANRSINATGRSYRAEMLITITMSYKFAKIATIIAIVIIILGGLITCAILLFVYKDIFLFPISKLFCRFYSFKIVSYNPTQYCGLAELPINMRTWDNDLVARLDKSFFFYLGQSKTTRPKQAVFTVTCFHLVLLRSA